MKISQKQIDAVLALPGPKRYAHFIKRTADQGEVWGLYQDGWALADTNDQNREVLPLWPAKEYAVLCAKSFWTGYTPRSISIKEFLQEFLPGLQKNEILPCVFYTPQDKGVIPTYEELRQDLEYELGKFVPWPEEV